LSVKRVDGPRAASSKRDVAEVVQTLRRLFRGLHEYSKAIQKTAGLSGPQVWALTLLEENPGCSARELAARMFVHPSTVTGVVERLVRKGAVSRVVDQRDRRSVRLYVRAAGKRVLKKSPPPIQVGLTKALAHMSARRLSELRRSLLELARETETNRISAPLFDVEA
jgi:DNA-binding MarR family transcriptional regulator